MQLNFTLLVCLVYLVVVCSGSDIFCQLECLVNFRADFCPLFRCGFSNELKHIPFPGVTVLWPRSVVRSATVEPLIVMRSGYRGPQCMCSSWSLKLNASKRVFWNITDKLVSLLKWRKISTIVAFSPYLQFQSLNLTCTKNHKHNVQS